MTAPAFTAKIAARLAPAALAALLAAGCTSLAPDYERPALPVPAVYPGAGHPGAGDLRRRTSARQAPRAALA